MRINELVKKMKCDQMSTERCMPPMKNVPRVSVNNHIGTYMPCEN